MKGMTLVALTLLGVFASTSAVAGPYHKGWYLGGMAGSGKLSAGDFNESAASFGAYGGYTFNKDFAIESTIFSTTNLAENGDLTAGSATIAAKLHHSVNKTYSIYLKLGLAATKVMAEDDGMDEDFDGTGWMWGAGINAEVSEHINIRLGYESIYTEVDSDNMEENIEADLAMIYLGVDYQF